MNNSEDYLIAYGLHEKCFTRIRARPGDSVLDVGAYIGSYSLRYNRIVGDSGYVTSFEPDPRNLRILKRNIALNGIQNISVSPLALGDFSGHSKLKLAISRPRSSLIEPVESGGFIQVRVTRLDDLHLQPDFVKIDTEGFELQILKGGEKTFSKFKPHMQIEVHSTPENCTVCPWLDEHGFEHRTIDTGNLSHWVEVNY